MMARHEQEVFAFVAEQMSIDGYTFRGKVYQEHNIWDNASMWITSIYAEKQQYTTLLYEFRSDTWQQAWDIADEYLS